MNRRFAPVSLLPFLICAAPAAAQEAAVDALVRAERAFAHDAHERTISDAFLRAMAPDAILFRPGPVNGIEWMRAHPAPPEALLEWEPEYAEVAASGDVGYTTGPWSSGRKGSDERAGFGRFASVWAVRDGRWQVLLDNGIAHAGPRPAVERVTTRTGTAPAAAPGDAAAADAALAERIRAGTAAEWAAVLAPDARVLRNGQQPAVGAAAAGLAAAGPAIRSWTRLGGGTASSGDLAWSYGEWRSADARGTYLHVWRAHEGGWRLALDVTTESPTEGG